MPYWKLFHRLILRPLKQEPLRTSLTALAVALGIAAVLAIELAGDAAAASFRSSMVTLAGKADFEVTSTGGVPADTLSQLARLPYPFKLHPRMEDYGVLSGSRRTVPVVGVDMLSESLPETESTDDPSAFQNEDPVWVGGGLGKVGDRLKITINDRAWDFAVRGVLGERSEEAIVMDLALAARVLRPDGTLDRILVEVPASPPDQNWETVLRQALPPGISVVPQGTSTDENRRMLAAFRWNLRVLSYIALTVGAFLIYNTISVSVVRRRFEIGILRALGATRGSIMAAFLGEAACFGLLGALVGIVFGRLMANGAVKMVATTVDSLYVSSRPGPITLTWGLTLLSVAIGIAVSAFSALSPAWEASLVAPVDAMARGRREYETHVHRWRDLLFGVILAALAWLAARQGPWDGKPVFGYTSAVLLIAAGALAIPALVSTLSSAGSRIVARVFGIEALLASRSLAGSLRRTSVLVGALATAIAMLTAVGIMVGSFRETVRLWMEDRLQADLYLRPAVPDRTDRHPTMSADVPDLLAKLPEVAAVDRFRAYEISYQGLPATLGGADARIAGRYGQRPFMSGRYPGSVFGKLIGTDNVIVSEPFANKHGVRPGTVLNLALGGKQGAFRVIDVYYDYSNERGFIIMDRGTLLKFLPDAASSNVAIYLKPSISPDQGRRVVEAALEGRRILIASNRTLRDAAMRIFDRTFAITYALEAVAIFVAIMGVGGALVALVIDRRREFGLLRFLGGGAGQIRRLILFEAGLLGLLANIAGLILGLFLSLLLIYVINKQSFGWTIQFHWPVGVLVGALSAVYVATVLAGLYPARIATRLVPIEVIHEE